MKSHFFCYFLFFVSPYYFRLFVSCFYSLAKPSARQPWPKLALAISGQLSLQATSGLEQKKLRSPYAMRNHVLRLFCLFNSITSGPLYSFIVMFLFIVFLVPIYYSFCVCFTSYIFVCYSFHYKYFRNYPTKKKKNPIPGTRALRISSCLSIACSQALLRLAFSIAYLICGLAPCC